jgi:RING finger/CHY zinc finger protein 1
VWLVVPNNFKKKENVDLRTKISLHIFIIWKEPTRVMEEEGTQENAAQPGSPQEQLPLGGAAQQALLALDPPLADDEEWEDLHSADGDEGEEGQMVAAEQQDTNRGCQHYRRGCKLVGPCCGEAFWCRFCHDAVKELGPPTNGQMPHKLDRHAVREVECGTCGLRQPVSQVCINDQCGNHFGNYFCRICNFFDDDLSKEPFHCDGCGICRSPCLGLKMCFM